MKTKNILQAIGATNLMMIVVGAIGLIGSFYKYGSAYLSLLKNITAETIAEYSSYLIIIHTCTLLLIIGIGGALYSIIIYLAFKNKNKDKEE